MICRSKVKCFTLPMLNFFGVINNISFLCHQLSFDSEDNYQLQIFY